jgi:hypothetical protein
MNRLPGPNRRSAGAFVLLSDLVRDDLVVGGVAG